MGHDQGVGDGRVPFVDVAAQFAQLEGEISQAVAQVLGTGDFILGEAVESFEAEMASFCGVAGGVGVDSGTSALELALRAAGIGPGDEVILPANTFIATALAVTHAGATPVLVDVDPDSFNIDPSLVPAALTARTRALVPVHLYGQPADMAPLLEIARDANLFVLEDASQAHGARYRGAPVGSLGDAAAFSLYPSKNLGAAGDAGIVVSDDADLLHRLRLLRNYGSVEKYHHALPGFNRRLDTLQAAILRVKLRHLDEANRSRQARARLYSQLLSDCPGVTPPIPMPGTEHVYHLYVVRVEERDRLRERLDELGIASGIHYPVPIHLQPAYADLGHGPGDFPVTEQLAREILSLPMYAEMAEGAVERVAVAVRDFVSAVGAVPAGRHGSMGGGR